MHFSQIVAALGACVLVSAAPTTNPPEYTAELEKRSSIASAAEFSELQRAAQLSSAAYTGCLGTAFDVIITQQINDVLTNTQGFVGYSTSKKRITVVMRGSTTVTDILNDIDTVLVTPSLSGVNFPSGVQIMTGVYTPWKAVHDSVISAVKSLVAKYPDYTLESTGHSLGGSLTYMSYIALAQNFPGKFLTSNALAAFPIGNAAFAAFGTAQTGLLRRGTNALDGVPNMYPFYTHFGTEFYGSGTAATTLKCTGERDLTCSAGNGLTGVTTGHFQSFGVSLGFTGCS
ncbi:putative lipase [Glonium stellatum]|uniref:Putative lipase n=1 Tax=Glonium stellatum TaxID=574774 RepID=A0A8E2F9M5_9PEZI|nr:putative lipase [Glonium stellatum]